MPMIGAMLIALYLRRNRMAMFLAESKTETAMAGL
jgi:hypothetical protein